MTNVVISIKGPEPNTPEKIIDLGEFYAVWRPGVTIGSDPDCTVVLPELQPVAVLVRAMSNHKVLYRMPEGATLPVPEERRSYDQRVDSYPFTVGPYTLCFGERNVLEYRLLTLAAVEPPAALVCMCACLRIARRELSGDAPDAGQSLVQVVEVIEAWVRGEGTLDALEGVEAPPIRSYGDHDLDWALQTAAARAAQAALVLAGEGAADRAALYAPFHAFSYDEKKKFDGATIAFIHTQRWPSSVPTRDELLAALPALAVAWDRVSDDRVDQSIDELLAAHDRAVRLGLAWSDPVQRAIAERTTDEPSVQMLLERR